VTNKTLKYSSDFPNRFGSFEDARQFCDVFFTSYNTEHRHSGISLLTPEVVHRELADAVLGVRLTVVGAAFALKV